MKGGYYFYPSQDELEHAKESLTHGTQFTTYKDLQQSFLKMGTQKQLDLIIKDRAAELFGPTQAIRDAAKNSFTYVLGKLNNVKQAYSNAVNAKTDANTLAAVKIFKNDMCTTLPEKIKKRLEGTFGMTISQKKVEEQFRKYLIETGLCNSTEESILKILDIHFARLQSRLQSSMSKENEPLNEPLRSDMNDRETDLNQNDGSAAGVGL